MSIRAQEISAIIRRQLEQLGDVLPEARNVGTVVEVGDGIARIYGLSDAMSGELLEFPDAIDPEQNRPVRAMALNLESENVGAIIMGPYEGIEEGARVVSTGEIASVPVGDVMVGRVVNALGQPIDGRGPINATKTRPIERIAPNVVVRKGVDTPLQTGIKAIDSMIPIGRASAS